LHSPFGSGQPKQNRTAGFAYQRLLSREPRLVSSCAKRNHQPFGCSKDQPIDLSIKNPAIAVVAAHSPRKGFCRAVSFANAVSRPVVKEGMLGRAGQITDLPVQPHFQKYFPSRLTQIISLSRASRPGRGAYRDRHERGMGCGGREGARQTSGANADGEVVWS
jgi:hypothetical protein